ncbi:MAG: tRNA pseudouridine(38-40) synthase TruA [Peptococcaceae bacterium]|nr:tRNA pseudouridine(38-40) synthase TruA [Peptococcaceae bacterium]
MRYLALTLAYDGAAYHGFQIQCAAHGPTIQGTLEATWFTLFGETIRVTPAGRTDAGVHAAGQVVSFPSESRIPTDKIGKAMNSLLPRDIRVLEAWETGEDFNARFSACWKRYDYWIDNRSVPDVFARRYAHHEPVALDKEAMRRTAQALVGRHNFRAFAAAAAAAGSVTPHGVRNFERTLSHCCITEEHGLLKMSFVGDGFLYNMVRIMAGTLLAFGKVSRKASRKTQTAQRVEFEQYQASPCLSPCLGPCLSKIQHTQICSGTEAEALQEILASQDRTRAGDTLPPHGLVLKHVEYRARCPSMVFADLPASDWENQLVAPREGAVRRSRKT